MLAPNGRLILHYGVLSPSSPYGGNPSDEMILGPRVILPQQDHGELKDWSMSTRLDVRLLTAMITEGDKN